MTEKSFGCKSSSDLVKVKLEFLNPLEINYPTLGRSHIDCVIPVNFVCFLRSALL